MSFFQIGLMCLVFSFPPIGGLEPGGLVVEAWCPIYPLRETGSSPKTTNPNSQYMGSPFCSWHGKLGAEA